MNINYTSSDIQTICTGSFLQNTNQEAIHSIAYDTRKIHQGSTTLFACLKTATNNGHKYIEEGYKKRVRFFLVDENVATKKFPEATFIKVNSVLEALQIWAKHHRKKFNIPVIAITGSAGKTTVKEWMYHVLSEKFKINRSPKSFNSQLGVALSLFEISEDTELAIIEAGISKRSEMAKLEEIIQPNIGVLTSFGMAHRENFDSEEDHFKEKIVLFKNCEKLFIPNQLKDKLANPTSLIYTFDGGTIEENNINLIRKIAFDFGITKTAIDIKIQTLPKIALRMESLDGINNNLLLFDAYNWNLDGLEQALGYQLSLSNKKDRYLILSKSATVKLNTSSLKKVVAQYSLKEAKSTEKDLLIFGSNVEVDFNKLSDAILLFKGNQPELKRLASKMKARNHSTFVEINLPALKNNIGVWKSRVPKTCQLLAMVKAQSYGAELTKITEFLVQQGIGYLGVAFADEGVELRKSGVKLPIIVMNTDLSSWQDCFQYKLEPSVYSFDQMEALVTELIHEGIDQFPIHLKFDTGMHRLGFQSGDLERVIQYIKAQPEIKVQSVFSHLADADNLNDSSFTLLQLKSFQHISENVQKALPYPILRHVLNSEGLGNYPEYCFDMVRLGIGMFGISSNPEVEKTLENVIAWKSTISQIKDINIGESLGYGRSFIADKKTKIAIIPVGYADGFQRRLSNGKGGVYVNGKYHPTVGRVCMDMLMIDCAEDNLQVGDEVEIIGPNQNLKNLADICDTIPYEIMTGLSARMPRVFIEEID